MWQASVPVLCVSVLGAGTKHTHMAMVWCPIISSSIKSIHAKTHHTGFEGCVCVGCPKSYGSAVLKIGRGREVVVGMRVSLLRGREMACWDRFGQASSSAEKKTGRKAGREAWVSPRQHQSSETAAQQGQGKCKEVGAEGMAQGRAVVAGGMSIWEFGGKVGAWRGSGQPSLSARPPATCLG